MPRQKIDAWGAKEMYERGCTVQGIADRYGVSRAAVWKAWKRIGYSTDGLRFVVKCSYCGKSIERRRSDVLKRGNNFCSQECYIGQVKALSSYKPWRQGQRRARTEASKSFQIPPRAVVDHRDGDCRNNLKSNLRVYASQADHMAMHRGGNVAPLWDGSKD